MVPGAVRAPDYVPDLGRGTPARTAKWGRSDLIGYGAEAPWLGL